MANLRRGEISAELGGRAYTLVLTLGALAELEAAFQARDLVDLARRFEEGRLRARDLIAVIGCGLRGGGAALADEEVAALTIPDGLQGFVRLAGSLLAATFGTSPQGEEAVVPPEPQDA
jgi:Phage tail tube protein, GTA-gp10